MQGVAQAHAWWHLRMQQQQVQRARRMLAFRRSTQRLPHSLPPRPAPPRQAATIPGDRGLLEEARKAASRLLAEQPDPRQWRPELVGLVASDSLLQLDTVTLPSLG